MRGVDSRPGRPLFIDNGVRLFAQTACGGGGRHFTFLFFLQGTLFLSCEVENFVQARICVCRCSVILFLPDANNINACHGVFG